MFARELRFRLWRIDKKPLSDLARCVPPIRAARQNDAAGLLVVDLRMVNAGWGDARLLEGARAGQEPAPRADDQHVRGSEVFVAAIHDRAHALSHRHVLLADTPDAGVALPRALSLAINKEVVIEGLVDVVAVEPACTVGQVVAVGAHGNPPAAGKVVATGDRAVA